MNKTREANPTRIIKASGSDTASRQQSVAQYVADMILELRNMAKSAKLPDVMVPLEFAYYEAYSAANRVQVPPDEIERIRRLERTVEELERADDQLEPPFKHAV